MQQFVFTDVLFNDAVGSLNYILSKNNLIRELNEKDVEKYCRGQRRSQEGGASGAVALDSRFQGATKWVEI
jgi:hypothetical protein